MKRCLICCEPLTHHELCHEHCSRQLFGRPTPPQLPYTIDELNELATKIVRQSIVVPGVQPKLSLHMDSSEKDHGRLTLIGWEGRFILKPPVQQYPEMPELEHLSMLLAGCFKIATVPFGLIPMQAGGMALVTRRIDRVNNQKLHMEDLCQLSDRLTENKYRASMELAGKTILKYSSNPILDALRFFEISLYSFLIGNADMHLKNFSLIHREDGLVVLAPAYDLLATNLLLSSDKEETALTINGRKNKITLNDFVEMAKKIHLNDKQISNALLRIQHAVPTALNRIQDGFISVSLQEKLTFLIQQRAQRLFGDMPQ